MEKIEKDIKINEDLIEKQEGCFGLKTGQVTAKYTFTVSKP